ncbi:MAG: hypothetical protein RRZ73_00785 [Oscillospiraceae bacterium]
MSKKQIKSKTYMQGIIISVILTFTAFFVMAGIGVVDIKGAQNGIGCKHSLISVDRSEDFNYTMSFMGNNWTVNLRDINQLAAFIKTNSFLIPINIRLAEQAVTLVILRVTNPELLHELSNVDKISAFFEQTTNTALNLYNDASFAIKQLNDNIQEVFHSMERNKIK